MTPDRYIAWAIAGFVIFAAVHDVLHWLGIGLGLAWGFSRAATHPQAPKGHQGSGNPPGQRLQGHPI